MCKALKVTAEVIILQLHPGLEHKRLHFHIDFLSLQMEIHTVHQIGPPTPSTPPLSLLSSSLSHKLIMLKLMYVSRVSG